MSKVTAQPRVSIEELVRGLRALPEYAFDETDKVRQVLATLPVDEASLAPYLTWSRQHYTRNLIDTSELYELLAICWDIGQASSVHNHRDQNCWMAAPVGRLLVENFRVEFQDLEAGKCRLAASNTVELTVENPCAVDPQEPVHRVVNPATRTSARSRCMFTRGRLTAASCIRPSREPAEMFVFITIRCLGNQ